MSSPYVGWSSAARVLLSQTNPIMVTTSPCLRHLWASCSPASGTWWIHKTKISCHIFKVICYYIWDTSLNVLNSGVFFSPNYLEFILNQWMLQLNGKNLKNVTGWSLMSINTQKFQTKGKCVQNNLLQHNICWQYFTVSFPFNNFESKQMTHKGEF